MADDAVWKSIEELRKQQANTDKCIAVVNHEREMQRKMITDQHGHLAAEIGIMRAKLDIVAADIHEARGGLRVGRWLGATFVTLAALGVSILAYFRGN